MVERSPIFLTAFSPSMENGMKISQGETHEVKAHPWTPHPREHILFLPSTVSMVALVLTWKSPQTRGRSILNPFFSSATCIVS